MDTLTKVALRGLNKRAATAAAARAVPRAAASKVKPQTAWQAGAAAGPQKMLEYAAPRPGAQKAQTASSTGGSARRTAGGTRVKDTTQAIVPVDYLDALSVQPDLPPPNTGWGGLTMLGLAAPFAFGAAVNHDNKDRIRLR